MYINTETLDKVALRDLRQDNPNISLPRQPTDLHLNPLGYAVLHPVDRPSGDVVTEGLPEKGNDGKWYQTWDVRAFTAEEAQTALDRAKQQATRRINDTYSQAMNAMVTEYPETERESWSKQEREARDWLADNTAPTPFMDGVLLVRTGTTKTQLANRIITKSDAMADATGQLTGKRHVKEAEIEAATTVSEVEAVTW